MSLPAHELSIDPALRAAVRELARTPHLLVASDYDGTLAPIVDNPADAKPLPELEAPAPAVANGAGMLTASFSTGMSDQTFPSRMRTIRLA